jgi:aldehyde:ferredoxin oxidoreductase
MFGWAGRILRVDLSRGRVVKEELKPAFAKAFLGGRGFNSKVLYDEFDPEIADPFSPENIVCIGVGALSGPSPSSSRVTVSVARSPITGVFGDGSAGGHFGPEMKFAGYDMLVIKGRSEKPVYLWIQDDDVEVRDARHLWGKDVVEAHHMLLEEADAEAKTMIIGPAGERLISMAIPVFTLERKPGGCGTGAVLGSKN